MASTRYSRCFALLLLKLLWGEAGAQQAFRTQPRNLTVRAGDTAVLRCEVLRPSGPVQWVKDGLLLGPQREMPGFPRYSMIGNPQRGQYHLQIEKAELEDDSPYECQVGQSESSKAIISHPVWLTVQIPPSQPYLQVDSSEPLVAGRKYSITCIAPDAKPEAEITLYKDGVELTDAESFTEPGSDDKLLNTNAQATVEALSSDDGKQLICQARNPAISQYLETSLDMQVFFPPQALVIQGLASDEVKAGKTLMLICLSHGGNPLATLQWTKNGEVLSTSWEEDTVARKSSSLLPLEVLPQDNQALLGCEATNLVSRRPLTITRRLTVHFEPKEVKVLGSFRAIEGKEVSLSCSASSSNPPVQIRWWLGFRELNSTSVVLEEGEHGGMTSTSNLTHVVSREENGLPLTCETFNKGTRFSKSQTTNLQVIYPPQKIWLDVPPEDIPLRSGTTVRLVCFSSGGSPTGSLTWYKNGKAIEASRLLPSDKGVSRELLLLLEPSDNQANYRCDATNSAKKTLTASSKLLVHFPATSVKIEAQQSVLHSGQMLQLECLTGSSNPQTNISWSLGPLRLQGVDLPPRKAAFSGVSVHSSLSLPLESQHHGKRVVCQAYSSLLSEGVSTFYQLDVLFPPEFSPDQPKQVQIQEDEVATLPLLVSANPDEVSCSWLFRKELLREGDATDLEIVNATRREAGVYTVQCTNELGTSHASITLDVQYAPSVKAEVNPVYVDVDGTADLLCVADANPISSDMFSWKWLGETEGEMDIGETTQREETGLLTILEATRASAGRYQCTADNGIAPPASAEVELVVRFKPQLQKGPQWTKVASRGDGTSTAKVVCQAEGIPRVDFSWTKNGVPMDFSNPRYEEQTVRESFIHTSTVTVVNVSAALDYVVFTCTARNPLGEDSLDVQLLSTNYPDPPSGLRLVDVTHNSITLEWIPSFDGGLEQRFRVRYRWAQSASSMYVDVHPPNANVFTVTGLSPATIYNLSVNALNAIGESGYADNNAILTITTEESLDSVEDTEEPGPGSEKDSDLSTSLFVSLGVGGVLLLINALGCFLVMRWRKRRGQTESLGESVSEEKKSKEGSSTLSTVSSSCRYEVRERLNPAAQHTLLIDSGSEPDGSIYESYGGESSHYYYPTGDYRPSLLPVLEGPPTHGTCYPTESHEYDEVRDWGLYQEVLPPTLPPPPAYAGPRVAPQGVDRRPLLMRPESGRRGSAFREQPIRINDRTADGPPRRRDYDLPFELRGELV